MVDCHVRRFNPMIPIPDQASRIHGIFNADVVDLPSLAEHADWIESIVNLGDVAGYNIRQYDWLLLTNEFLRATDRPLSTFGAAPSWILDAMLPFHSTVPYSKGRRRNLEAAVHHYLRREHYGHSALRDALAVAAILDRQAELHGCDSVDAYAAYCDNCIPYR
jgi:DNA polymerase-3 subunit epsilon